jgi:acetyl esterase/lipase
VRAWSTAAVIVVFGLARLSAAEGPAARYKGSPVDTAHGDREFFLLWPQGAPGALGDGPEDRPKLTVYRARAGSAIGTAVIVCPGGSYQHLASDHEGKQVAEWLNGLGVTAFVLQYRVGPRYHHPIPLQDLQRAIRIVRSRAREFGIDAGRVGIIGFSAGGHLASTAGTHLDESWPDPKDPLDQSPSRPDFMVLGYPIITFTPPFAHKVAVASLLGDAPTAEQLDALSNERRVTSATPPTFLFHTAEDPGVAVENSVLFFEALHKAGVPAALHVFTKGGHGVGLAKADPGLAVWPEVCATWLRTMGFLSPAPPARESADRP